MEHFGLLLERAQKELSGKSRDEFIEVTIKLYKE